MCSRGVIANWENQIKHSAKTNGVLCFSMLLNQLLIALDSGVPVTINGQETNLCDFVHMYIGDMPQQQENSGMKSQNGKLGCRSCFIPRIERDELEVKSLPAILKSTMSSSKLPLELRPMIYKETLSLEKPITVSIPEMWDTNSLLIKEYPGILLASQQIYEEALPYLFRNTVRFEMHHSSIKYSPSPLSSSLREVVCDYESWEAHRCVLASQGIYFGRIFYHQAYAQDKTTA